MTDYKIKKVIKQYKNILKSGNYATITYDIATDDIWCEEFNNSSSYVTYDSDTIVIIANAKGIQKDHETYLPVTLDNVKKIIAAYF